MLTLFQKFPILGNFLTATWTLRQGDKRAWLYNKSKYDVIVGGLHAQ